VPESHQDEYRIEECKKRFFVIHVSTGGRFGPYPSPKAARNIIESLFREPKPVDLKTQTERKTRAAYRLLERDPVLQLVRKLAKQGRHNTQASYDAMMRGKMRPGDAATLKAINEQRFKEGKAPHAVFSFEKCMSVASSDPHVHAELNKTAGQRRISKAARAHTGQGDATRTQVSVRLKALGDTPAHKRASQIAQEMNLDPAYVRRVVRQLLR
jgi:hypothetical protein